METLKRIWNFLFNYKTINSKQYIEELMTKRYGKNWFEEMIQGLRDPNVRKPVANKLGLNEK